MKPAHKALSIIVALFLILFLFIARKMTASTQTIKDERGNMLQSSITSLEKIRLGGMDQYILIRGYDKSNPILLWLHGGPGSAQMPVASYYNGDLEKDFVVIHWDQRGAGKSNPADFDESTMTFEQFLSDAHELTKYLKERFHTEKIYLVGHSWGTELGIKLVQSYPEDYYAYIAVSQVVDAERSDIIAHTWLLNRIKETGNQKDLAALEGLGQPPYSDHDTYVKFAHMLDSYGGGMDVSMFKLALAALQSPEYSLKDYAAWLNGASRGSGRMWDSIKSFNIVKDVPQLLVPVYFFSGKNDYNTPVQLVEEYYDFVKAPKGKKLIIFQNSSHTPFMAEAKKFNEELVEVKKETYRH